jgi:hypothetical protein
MNELPDRERASFLDEAENWRGGFYELSITLGPRDDARLEAALWALWRSAELTGPFAAEPGGQHERVELGLRSLEANGHLRGVAEPPSVGRIVAGALAIRFDRGEDVLVLYIPMGALARTDARIGGFPFGPVDSDTSWTRDLDGWLAMVGQRAFRQMPYLHASVGIEGFHDWEDSWATTAPTHRSVGLLIPSGDVVAYLPATIE